VWPISTQMEGGSPTVWTMLYPLMETARLQTYTRDGHLDNFMPWTACMQDRTQPPLISQAMWNIWKGSNSPMLQTSPEVFQKSGPPLANPTGFLQATSTPITIVPPHPTKSMVPTNIISVLAALMAYLLVQQSSNPEPAAQQLIPPTPQHWHNPGISRVKVGMSWKSCLQWTMAIIQL